MATLDAAEALSPPPIVVEFLECLGAKQQPPSKYCTSEPAAKQQPPSKKRKVEDESLDECAGLLIDAETRRRKSWASRRFVTKIYFEKKAAGLHDSES